MSRVDHVGCTWPTAPVSCSVCFSRKCFFACSRARVKTPSTTRLSLCEFLLFPHGHAQSVFCGLREQHPTCFSYLVASSSLPAVLSLSLSWRSFLGTCLLVFSCRLSILVATSLLPFVLRLLSYYSFLRRGLATCSVQSAGSLLYHPFVFCLSSCGSYLGSAPTFFAGRCMPLTTFTTCIE